jgi:DNA-binding NarL/FixJ family response regulator
MPKMNGREVYEKVRALRRAARVVFMSGYTETGVVQNGVVENGIAFIQKPFAPADLALTIRSVLDEALVS